MDANDEERTIKASDEKRAINVNDEEHSKSE